MLRSLPTRRAGEAAGFRPIRAIRIHHQRASIHDNPVRTKGYTGDG